MMKTLFFIIASVLIGVPTEGQTADCVDHLPNLPKECKNFELTCSKLPSQCKKTLYYAAESGGKKCQKKIKKKDAKKKMYQFCERSCSRSCKPKATPAPKSKPEPKATPAPKSTPEPKATPAPKSTPEPKPTPAPTSEIVCEDTESWCAFIGEFECNEYQVQMKCPKACHNCTGVSLKEYQKQLDIFKKSIDAQRRDMGKLKALLDKVQGDLSEEKTIREKSDQEEKESREQSDQTIQGRVVGLETTALPFCSRDSDCPEPLHYCLGNGWCSVTECRNDLDCPRESESCDIDEQTCTPIYGYTYRNATKCWGYDIGSSYSRLSEATAACRSDESCGCVDDYSCDGINYRLHYKKRTSSYEGRNYCSWLKT